jgi:ketosteroid isomerase-like protein
MATKSETVKAIYDAFATGNIPFILESVSEDFTWHDPSNPSIVPYGGTHKGRSGFLEFFQKMGGSTDTTLFQVDGYISEGDKVVATGKHGFHPKTTGKNAVTEWTMIWTFDKDIPVAGRAYYNTSGAENAFS